jgi:hypothetical protein
VAPTAGSCTPTTPEPTPPFPGTITSILQDNFEEGPGQIGSPWTVVDQEGDATAVISTAQAHTGTCAGLFTVTTSSGSRAYISKDLGGSKTDVWASGWFYVDQAGAAGSNVPYLRFFDGPDLQNDRIVSVFRSNDDGKAWLGTADANGDGGFAYVALYVPIPLDTWHQVILHVVPNGAASTIQVWIDPGPSGYAGTPTYTNASYALPTTATQLTTVLLGNEKVEQQMVEYFDDVTIGTN